MASKVIIENNKIKVGSSTSKEIKVGSSDVKYIVITDSNKNQTNIYDRTTYNFSVGSLGTIPASGGTYDVPSVSSTKTHGNGSSENVSYSPTTITIGKNSGAARTGSETITQGTSGLTASCSYSQEVAVYYLDLNSYIMNTSGTYESSGGLPSGCTADVYINGSLDSTVNDWYQQKPYGTTYQIKNFTTPTGFTFNSTKSGYTAAAGTSGTITGTVTVAPYYERNKYSLAWGNGGGSLSGGTSAGSVYYGISLTAPTASRTGYTFAGWSPSVPSTMPASNATYTATWSANTYTITFNANGGSGGTSSTTIKYDTAVGSYPSITLPSRTGYTFAGYYDAASGGTQYYNASGNSVRVWNKASDTTLYAHWDLNYYTLSIGASVTNYTVSVSKSSTYGGTVGSYTATTKSAQNISVPYGATYSVNWASGTDTETTSGFTITWNANGGSTPTGGASTSGNKTRTRSASYTDKSGTITGDVNAGSSSWGAYGDYTYGTVGTLASASRSRYTFDGWYTAVSGGSKISASTRPTGAVTYYAHWTANTVAVPTAISGLVYNGKSQTGISGYNTSYMSLSSGSTSGTNAGSYSATFAIGSNYMWSDGSTANKTVDWSIAKASQSAPTATGASTTYPTTATATASGGGGVGTLTWENQSRSSVGSQTARCHWSGNDNYNASGWSNSVTVSVAQNNSATASAANKTYNGSSQTGVSGSNVDWSGTTSGTNAGSYTAYATPKTGYGWSDGTTSQKTISWSIAREGVTFTWGTVSWTYDGSAHSTTCTAKGNSSGASYTVSLSGNSITNAGTTTVTATVDATNAYGTASKTLTVSRAATATCESVGTVNYTGSALTGYKNNTYVTFSGTTSATDTTQGSSKSYSFTATPDSNHAWSDGTTSAKPFSWVIKDYVTSTTHNPRNYTVTAGTITNNLTAAGGSISWTAGSAEHTVSDLWKSGYVNNDHTVTDSVTSSASGTRCTDNGNRTASHGNMTTNETTDTFTVTWKNASNTPTTTTKTASVENSKSLSSIYLLPYQPDSTWIVTVSNENWNTVPASGGYIKSYGYYTYSYTSGSSKDELKTSDASLTFSSGYNDWITAHSNGGYYIHSRGTLSGDARTVTVTWTSDGKSATKQFTQAANSYSDAWNNPVVSASCGDISAGGNTVTPTYSATQSGTRTWTSGSTQAISNSSFTWSFSGTSVNTSTGAVTGSSLSTTPKARTKITTATIAAAGSGSKSGSKSVDVYQAANALTGLSLSLSPTTIAYGSTATPTPTASYTSGGSKVVTASYSSSNTSYVSNALKCVGVGISVTITASYTDNGVTKTATATLGTKRASQSAPTATGYSGTYDGNAHSASASGGGGQGTLTWSTTNSRTNAGETPLYAYWAGNDNYEESPDSNIVKISISARAVTYTADNQSKTYNGTALSAENTATLTSGSLVSGHTASFSCNGTITNVGSTTKTLSSVTIKSGSTDVTSNYSITKKNGTLSVIKAATASASAILNLTYNGGVQTGVTGSYVTWTGTTSATDAGSYTAYATPDSNHTWSDGTSTQKTITWAIALGVSNLTLSKSYMRVSGKSIEDTVTWSENAGPVTVQIPQWCQNYISIEYGVETAFGHNAIKVYANYPYLSIPYGMEGISGSMTGYITVSDSQKSVSIPVYIGDHVDSSINIWNRAEAIDTDKSILMYGIDGGSINESIYIDAIYGVTFDSYGHPCYYARCNEYAYSGNTIMVLIPMELPYTYFKHTNTLIPAYLNSAGTNIATDTVWSYFSIENCSTVVYDRLNPITTTGLAKADKYVMTYKNSSFDITNSQISHLFKTSSNVYYIIDAERCFYQPNTSTSPALGNNVWDPYFTGNLVTPNYINSSATDVYASRPRAAIYKLEFDRVRPLPSQPQVRTVTVDLNGEWSNENGWTYCPDRNNYYAFTSYSNHNQPNSYSSMKITWNDDDVAEDFKIYINSYAESSYDYTIAFNPDYPKPASNPSSTSNGVKAHTSNFQKDPNGSVGSNYKEVKYLPSYNANTYCWVCYRKDSGVNSNYDKGTVLIPKYLSDGTAITLNVINPAYTCLLGDTMVTMADNSTKRIDEIHVGDMVLSMDYDTKQLIPRKVIYSDADENKTSNSWDKWTFSDGTVIKTTYRHEFYNAESKCWKYLDEWNIGEHAYTIDGRYIELVSHETINEDVNHYKITLEGDGCNNYFANGLLNGDRYCPKDFEL